MMRIPLSRRNKINTTSRMLVSGLMIFCVLYFGYFFCIPCPPEEDNPLNETTMKEIRRKMEMVSEKYRGQTSLPADNEFVSIIEGLCNGLADAWGNRMTLERKSNSYLILKSAGADLTFGTGDDIVGEYIYTSSSVFFSLKYKHVLWVGPALNYGDAVTNSSGAK